MAVSYTHYCDTLAYEFKGAATGCDFFKTVGSTSHMKSGVKHEFKIVRISEMDYQAK